MTRQSLKDQRFAEIETLRQQIQAWAKKTNDKQRGVNWEFSIDQARVKLKSIYPEIEC